MALKIKTELDMPLEVQLAWKVMTCRGMRDTYDGDKSPSKWFNEHYGPYPSYDWIDKYPIGKHWKRGPLKYLCTHQAKDTTFRK